MLANNYPQLLQMDLSKGFRSYKYAGDSRCSARFLEYSLRPGSSSDKNLWTMSSLGQNIANHLPHGMDLIGDAGYTLSEHLIIRHDINDDMTSTASRFNYFHCRTRITVERAFGLLKGRWRFLKRSLNMKSPASIG
jgi:hypothetical protein